MGVAQVSVRPGRFEDITAESELNASLDWCYDERATLVEFHDNAYEPSSVLIAEIDGRVVGKLELFMAHKSTHGRFGIIRRFAVVEDLRGMGIGTTLLDAATARARAAGCTFLELSVNVTNSEAHAFYRREGYVEDRVEVLLRRPLDGQSHASDFAAQADPSAYCP